MILEDFEKEYINSIVDRYTIHTLGNIETIKISPEQLTLLLYLMYQEGKLISMI